MHDDNSKDRNVFMEIKNFSTNKKVYKDENVDNKI